ncbi:TDP-4-oxo-6-deoxy-alpha-D-glucose-3, 4-oxoisomerase [Paraburkholderia sabiae]|uniref:sugar 3,4-ketoisomerase n=1 Tax=Paraburkholderia sabiae TaxID=273251 RepID=UPI001CB655D1|nr:FdtA/QdtA family cupin domain-containing protein [Paraburkholderia sabiae]CAG9213055.1 TDP-4-oxo-6-deoxy-alpha-D-glucose-3, 4-oxoisomerase [Paraburkholderia sabiae]
MASVHDCQILEFPRIQDPRGTLTPIENHQHIPFEIKRVYYLYDVPGGASRAGHSHKELRQVLIAVSGSFDVHLDDGHERRVMHLNRPHQGLLIPRMIWREIDNFSSNAVCIALASLPYDESDYYRHYDDFIRAVKGE